MLRKGLSHLPLLLLIGLLGACQDKPTDAEIRAALAPRLAGPSCMTSVLFKAFPVSLGEDKASSLARNADVFEALSQAGLLSKQGNTYELTELGRSAWKAKESGFCYSPGYEVKQIKDVAALDRDQVGPAVEQGWTVAVDIGQQKVADWTKSPAVVGLAERKAPALAEAVETYHVILGRVRGEQGLQVIDPRFSVSKGFSVNMGW